MQKIIIDTDPGIDDAHAILLALAHPNTEVVAITAVSGNVGIQHTSRNALTILDVAQANHIPVFAGSDGAFVLPGPFAAHVHGDDGLGNAGSPTPSQTVEPKHAAAALIQLASEQPGELTLVTLGPLTNVATALKLDGTLPDKFAKLVCMAGAVTAQGNVTPTAEFNVFADPEAAHVVFAAWPELTLVDWEATVRHAIPVSQAETWRESSSPKAQFYNRIMAHYFEWVKGEKRPFYFAADGLAMAVAVEPEIVQQAETHHLSVELNGRLTRGQTVVDWRDQTNQPANAHIVQRIDHQRFITLMTNALT